MQTTPAEKTPSPQRRAAVRPARRTGQRKKRSERTTAPARRFFFHHRNTTATHLARVRTQDRQRRKPPSPVASLQLDAQPLLDVFFCRSLKGAAMQWALRSFRPTSQPHVVSIRCKTSIDMHPAGLSSRAEAAKAAGVEGSRAAAAGALSVGAARDPPPPLRCASPRPLRALGSSAARRAVECSARSGRQRVGLRNIDGGWQRRTARQHKNHRCPRSVGSSDGTLPYSEFRDLRKRSRRTSACVAKAPGARFERGTSVIFVQSERIPPLNQH